jgi:putative tricarboxylic transport membrane protein
MQDQQRTFVHRRQLMLGAAWVAASSAVPAMADTYPNRPVRIIVPSTPGSGTDILARLLGSYLQPKWGQPVVVYNREGAGGVIGTELASKATPDGYTLYMGFTGPISVSPLLVKNLAYDPTKAFTPVTLVDSSPNVMVVSPALGVSSVMELVELAKSKPGAISYGSAGVGTQGHLCAALFTDMSDTKMLHVPYKAESQAVTDLVSGQIGVLFHVAAAVMPLARAGKLKALAVTSLKRWDLLPDLPAISETVPSYQITVWHGVLAPSQTPPAVVGKLQQDMAAVMKDTEARARFIKAGVEPLGTTSEEFAQFLKDDAARSAGIVKHANMHID